MAGRGEEQEESKPIHGIDLGIWLQKKLENLSAAPDELDHACREARDFASHFRVSYDIFLSIMEAAKPVFYLVPAPSETCWFRGMSVGGSFRRVEGRAHPQEMQPTGCLRDSACRLRRGGGMVG